MKIPRALSRSSAVPTTAFSGRKGRKLTRLPFAAWLLVAGSALALQGKAFSADQTWLQANSNNEWSLSAPDWDTGLPWTNGSNAIFGDTGEAVELAGNLSVGDITFNSNGYVIGDGNGDGQLTFGGSPSTITVTTAGQTATISDSIAGGAITTAGLGTLVLSGANTFTGMTTVSSGALQVANNAALGDTTGITRVSSGGRVIVANGVTVTGETINLFGGGDNFGALQAGTNATATWAGTVNLADGGVRIGTGVGGVLTLSGPIQNGGGTVLNISANSTGLTNVGVVVISGTNNTYSGATNIVRGILKLGASNALPTGTVLDVDVTTAAEDSTFDLNGFNQTVAALQRTGIASGGGSFITNSGATTGTLTVNQSAATTFTGVIKDGTSTVALVKSGTGTLTLSGANIGTGTTTLTGGGITLTGAGRLASTAINLNAGIFTVDNLGTANNSNDRLADTSDLNFGGGTLSFKGSDQTSTSTSETVGNLTLGAGLSLISLQAGSTNTATLSASQLTHAVGGGIALVNGTGLGTATAARLLLTTAPVLVGTTAALSTGINTAAQNTQIVPFLLGEATATTGGFGTVTGVANTFLTYDPTTGLRPLNPTDEFSSTVVAGNNVRIASSTTVTSNSSLAVNSLVMSSTATTGLSIGAGVTLTNTSGAILFTTAGSIGGGTIAFGSAEAIITVNGGLTAQISSKITGSSGMVIGGAGTLAFGSNASTYSGSTVLANGILVPQTSSVVTSGTLVSGPLGVSTLILAGGQIRAASGNAVDIANPVTFRADTSVPTGGGFALTLSGPITLTGGTRTLSQNTGQQTILAGNIGDGGLGYGFTLAGSGAGAVIFSGTNTYSGTTTINSGRTLQIGNGGTTGTLGSGSVVNSGSLNFNRTNAFTVANPISGSGSLTQIGSGSTTLSGTNTYTGPTTVKAGSLLISGAVTGGITVGDAASLATAAVLGGSGTVGSVTATGNGNATTSGAAVNPGNASGTAGILRTGAFSVTNGAHLRLDIGGASVGGESTTGYDQIVAGGAVTLTGGDLSLTLLGTPVFATGDLLYLIINNSGSSLAGTFATLGNSTFDPQNIVVGGQAFQLIYNASFAGAGSDGVANDVALLAVPEPTSWAMMLGGVGMLILFRRPGRRRA